MQIKLDKRHLRAALCAAADRDIRYYLNGVFVEATKNETRVTGTNGHIVATFRMVATNEIEKPISLLIPREVIETIKKEGGAVLHHVEETGWTLTYDSTTVKFVPIDGTYPDYRRVFPEMISGETAQFAPDYIAVFAKIKKILKGKYEPTIHHNGARVSIVSIIGCDEFIGVMGRLCYVHEGEPIAVTPPNWVNKPME